MRVSGRFYVFVKKGDYYAENREPTPRLARTDIPPAERLRDAAAILNIPVEELSRKLGSKGEELNFAPSLKAASSEFSPVIDRNLLTEVDQLETGQRVFESSNIDNTDSFGYGSHQQGHDVLFGGSRLGEEAWPVVQEQVSYSVARVPGQDLSLSQNCSSSWPPTHFEKCGNSNGLQDCHETVDKDLQLDSAFLNFPNNKFGNGLDSTSSKPSNGANSGRQNAINLLAAIDGPDQRPMFNNVHLAALESISNLDDTSASMSWPVDILSNPGSLLDPILAPSVLPNTISLQRVDEPQSYNFQPRISSKFQEATLSALPNHADDLLLPNASWLMSPQSSVTSTPLLNRGENYSSSSSSASWPNALESSVMPYEAASTASLSHKAKDSSSLSNRIIATSTSKNFTTTMKNSQCPPDVDENILRAAPSKRRNKNRSTKARQKKTEESASTSQRRRRPFENEEQRKGTARTRELKACLRCRMQRIRCEPSPEDPHGACLSCVKLTRPTMNNLPCMRLIITDASLYREQTAPYQLFSKRWQNMDLVDISDWASDEIRTIELTHVFTNCPYKVDVRRFVPVEGDMLEEQWNDDGVVKRHAIPPYAIANMEKTARDLRSFFDRNTYAYIDAAVGNSDPLIWKTYQMAFKHMGDAKTETEKSLLLASFRLWVACRATSNPHRICGDDRLGVEKVNDPASPWYKVLPMPPIMMAQNELIVYTKLLRPLSKAVLAQLQALVLENKRNHWFTVYLTNFILLHSCSMITRRDWEYARQISLKSDFANPSSISGHHMGAVTMLAYFHYCNKGKQPFKLALDPRGIQEVAEFGELNANQVQSVRETAELAKAKEQEFKRIRENREIRHDFYWVSQLYEVDWDPPPTA